MATSKTFFGLRSGSTKNLTFSVMNGKQVTRERVSNVKNPKTGAQSLQRMKLAPAARFYRAFESILSHSFEGYAYGNRNRQRFMQLALLRQDGPFMAKDNVRIPLSKYQISDGSLPSVEFGYLTTKLRWEMGSVEVSDTKVSSVSKALLSLGMYQVGDQFTTLLVEDSGACRFSRFILSMDDDSTVDLWSVSAGKLVIDAKGSTCAVGVIVSRKVGNTWQRSKSFMQFSGDDSKVDDNINNLSGAVKSFGALERDAEGVSKWYLNHGSWFNGVIRAIESSLGTFMIGVPSDGSDFVIFTTTGDENGFLINKNKVASKHTGKEVKDVYLVNHPYAKWGVSAGSLNPATPKPDPNNP